MMRWLSGIGALMIAAFLADPEQHRQRLIDLARAALGAGQVGDEEFGEMLELLDCAKIWAEVELAEAEEIGLFVGRTPGEGGPVKARFSQE